MSVETAPSRRRFMQASGALGLAAALPGVVRAQGAPLQLGVLTPLTGAGGFDGPRMAKADMPHEPGVVLQYRTPPPPAKTIVARRRRTPAVAAAR